MIADTTRLKGKYIYLELISEDDREAIRTLAKQAEIWEYTKTLQLDEKYDNQFNDYFDTALKGTRQQSFLIRQVMNGLIIGMTRFLEIDAREKRLEIGHTWYIPSVWGSVYNKECKFLLLQYVFEDLQFNRVEFRVAHQNIRSQKAVTKIGGVFEGILRKHAYRNDGSTRNTVVYSIINDEWPGKKKLLLELIERCEASDGF